MKKIIFSILFFSILILAYAQKKKQAVSAANLELKKKELLKEIEKTESDLKEVQSTKIVSIEALKVLQRKLEVRNKLVNNINEQVVQINKGLENTNIEIDDLNSQLQEQRKEYAELVRYAYKNRTSQSFILFLFSAKSFNEAANRLRYVKQYRNYKADKAKKIEGTTVVLEKQINILSAQKKDKNTALISQKEQNIALERETDQQNKMVAELKGKEGELLKSLANKKKIAAQLNSAIADAIKKEVEAAQKRAYAEQLKKKQEELALKEKAKREADALAKKQEAERKLAEQKRQQELELQRLAELKRKQEEDAKALADAKKKQEEDARKLLEEQRKREEEEKKSKALAEQKRKEREAELLKQKQEQDNRAIALQKEKDRQEALRKKLEEEKRKQELYEQKLLAEKKRIEVEQKKQEEERKINADKVGEYKNPRYIPDLADKDAKVKRDAEAKRLAENTVNNNYTIALSEAERNLSSNFEANQGRLPWPVNNGFIAEHFGKNKHPLHNVYTENYGIDIRTQKGSVVYAIFPGEISSILNIPGAGQTVIINHGSYYTVYSKLSNVKLSKGAKVTMKQVLGNVQTDDNGACYAHFEVWKVGADGTPYKLNPESWVRGN